MVDSTNPRVMADNIKELSAGIQANAGAIEANADAIEALGSYSTNAVNTGMLDPDGKHIYRKIIKIPNLPNATTISVPHGITGLKDVYDITLIMQEVTAHDGCPIPYSTAYTLRYNSTNVIITSTGDISDRPGILTILYTVDTTREVKNIVGSLDEPIKK